MEQFYQILLILFFFGLAIQLFFVFFFFLRLIKHKTLNREFHEAVSIIICARNEAENLKEFLPLVLQQSYFNYEVVVVNDQSKDNTEYVLKSLEKEYSHLNIVKIEKHVKHRTGKKFALTLGIKAAKNEYLLLTDADCVPSSEKWLKKMVHSFDDKKKIILGYGAYKKGKGLLNLMIRFDAFNISLQYFSYALAGMPYMGVGRNLAYKKSIFFSNKGFASHIHLASGDDDLFVQEVATKENIAIEFDADSHTISNTKESWKEWIFQKRRHSTTSKHYMFRFKFFILLWPFSLFLFWISFFFLLFIKENVFILLLLFAFRFILFFIVYFLIMKKLKLLDLLMWFPVLEIIHIFIQGFFVLLNIFNKPTTWR